METPGGGDDDRLSHLPDSLLEDVLSRLTSLQAVRTSVLSRRWRHLWRAVPCVDIDQREFLTSEAIDVFAAEDRRLASEQQFRLMLQEWDALEDLADVLLPPQQEQQGHAAPPPLNAVRLRFAAGDFRAAYRWVRRALLRRPAAFHLRCDNDGPFSYNDDRYPVFPVLALTRRLRTMHLSGLNLVQDFADDVADECPVLEDLHLHDCETLAASPPARSGGCSWIVADLDLVSGGWSSSRPASWSSVSMAVATWSRTQRLRCQPSPWRP
ncbi:hypothetical protein U9M48_001320 [Paspalum notatum var. saurae]|uniref:F-box domain-containing protein n=1 Tax=Paspalum notatum var. saurae TaxID=547442 RepID=A0AAQ3PI46_PASNO